MNFIRPKNIYYTIPSYSRVKSNNKSYSFMGSHSSDITFKNNTACALLESYFFSVRDSVGSLLYSSPTYSHSSTKVTVHIFYYSNIKNSNKEKSIKKFISTTTMSSLGNCLSAIYKKEVSLIMTRVNYPYLNSSIFAKYLAHNAPSNTFIHFQDSIITYPSRNASELPAYISGIKIELSGRLLTEPVVPRMTKKVSLFGSFSGVVDYAKYTTKNELGAFTIKI